MENLYIIIERFSKQYFVEFLDVFFFLCILFALLVITTSNPVVSVLFLISLFGIISSYLILVGMNFIGISYLLVYIGAISILFLFILMLINIRISETKFDTINSLPLSILISISFFIPLYSLVPLNGSMNQLESHQSLSILFSSPVKQTVIYVKTLEWEIHVIEIFHISNIGNILYTNYLFLLIIASIILLLAMIGAIIITKK